MSAVFRQTLKRCGGGGQFPHPKYVWSPAGGWWGNTKDGPRNTVIAAGVIVATSASIWSLGSSLEVSLILGWRIIPTRERRSEAAEPRPGHTLRGTVLFGGMDRPSRCAASVFVALFRPLGVGAEAPEIYCFVDDVQ